MRIGSIYSPCLLVSPSHIYILYRTRTTLLPRPRVESEEEREWRLGEQSEFQQEEEENSGVYGGRGCRASTFHFRRQGGSFLFRMEEFVSRSPRAKPGKREGKRGKKEGGKWPRVEEGGKSRKKQIGVKQFKYTLEIKICSYANA